MYKEQVEAMRKILTAWVCAMIVMTAFVMVAMDGTGSDVSEIFPLSNPPSEVKGIHIDEVKMYTNSLSDFIDIPFWSTDNLDSVKVTVLNSERTEYPDQIVWQDDDDWSNYTSFEEQLASGNTTYSVALAGCSVFRVHIMGHSDAPDLDLGIFLDGKDGQPIDETTQPEEFVAYSADWDADEEVILENPVDGTYLIKVFGYMVTSEPGHFDMTIDIVSESPGIFSAAASPDPLDGFTLRNVNLTWDIDASESDGIFMGGFYIGTDTDPHIHMMPVNLNLDRTPPEINDNSFEGDQPTIWIQFTVDYNAELDQLSPRLSVDGKDVTACAEIYMPKTQYGGWGEWGRWNGYISYTPEKLINGIHPVNFSVADIAGNVAHHNRTFTVNSQFQPGILHNPEVVTNIHYITPINAIIESDFEIAEALLLYKAVGQGTFTAVRLSKIGTNTYHGQIPAQSTAGTLQYYLAVEDVNGNTATSPSVNPETEPHLAVVNDFGHPIISHDPVLYCGDSDLEIFALISDDIGITSATLYCKNEVDADYTSVAMDNVGGHVHSATVASGIINAHNLSYYISATDGENTVTHPCNIDEPHRAEYMATGVPGGTLRVAIQEDAKSMNPLAVSDEWSWKVLGRIYDGPMTAKPTTNEIIPYIAVGSANESSKTEGWNWDDCAVGNFRYNPKDTWNSTGPNVGEAVIFYDFENVTWHDGHQMDVRDVMFSMHLAAQKPEWSAGMNPLKDLGGGAGSNYTSTSWLHIYKVWESPDSLQAALKFELQEPFADFFTNTLDVILFPYHIWGNITSGQNVDGAKIWCDSGYDINADDSWKLSAAQSYENIPPVGCGHFEFEIWSKGQYAIINTFRQHFFGTDYKYADHVLDEYGVSLAFQPNIDSVIFRIYKTAEAAVLALKNDDIDYISWSLPPSYVQDLANEPGIDIIETPESGFFYLAYNMRRTSFGYLNGDPENGDVSKPLRKAIAHCIDKDSIVNLLLQGHGIAGDGPISPSSDWYNASIPRYSFAPNEAKTILANSGYLVNENGTLLSGQDAIDAAGPGNWWVNPNGTNIGSESDGKIEILTPEASYDPIRAQAGLMIAQQLRDVGIYAESIAMDFGSIVDRIENRDFDMYILGWSIGSEPADYLWEFFHSTNAQTGQNYPGYQNTSFDALMDYARATSDTTEKRDSIFQAHASLCHDLPYDVLYYRTNIEAYRSDRFVGWVSKGGTIYNDHSLRRIHQPDLEFPSPNIEKKEFGGTMRVALETEPGPINPLVSADEDSLKVMDLVFDSLARVDPGTLETVPWIAESWSVSPDNVTVRVNLRADVRWHDGELLDAHDVKYTFDTYGPDYLSSVVVMDPLTVDFHMAHPDSRFFGEAVLMKLIPEGFSSLDVGNGCGPFVMAGRLPGESLDISANPDYFAGRPNIDAIRFMYYDEFTNASNDLMSGHLDLIGWELTTTQLATNVDLNGTNTNLLMHPDINTPRYNELSQMYLGFNTQNTPLDQTEVRRAIAQAVDKEMLTMYDISGSLRIADSLASPFNFPFCNVSADKYRSDIQQANRILDAAGFFDRDGDGWRNMATSPYDSFHLTMLGPPMEDVTGYTMTTNIVTWLHQIGLNVTLISVNETERWQQIENGDFDIYFDNLRTGRDPAFLNDLAGTGSTGNHANYTDATMEFLLDRMNAEMNQTLRATYAQDCFGWLAQELPYLPLMDVRYHSAYNKNGFAGWVSTLGGPVNFWSFLRAHPVFDPASTSLDAPQALFAVRMNSTSVRLTWAANKEVGLTGYTVYRSDTHGGPYAPIASTDIITSYIDDTTNPHENFFYVITAKSPESGYSDEAHVSITHVLSTQPAHGDSGVLPTLDVVVVFSDSMNTSVIPTLSQAAGTSVSYTFAGWSQTNSANDTATWIHDSWAQNDVMILNVSGYEDLYGNVGTGHIWSFDTEDTIPPTSSVNDVAPYWRNSSPLELTATADDEGTGIAFVEFWYRYRPNNVSAWSPNWTIYYNDTFSAGGWAASFGFPDGQGYYEFHSRAEDNAGNYEGAPATADTTAGYDVTIPTADAGSDTITNAPFLRLGTAADALSGIASYQWQGPAGIIFSTPNADNTTINAAMNGVYIIWFNVTDNAGNIGSSNFTLTWDATGPTVDAGSDVVTNTQFLQDATATDAGSGIANYSWSMVSGPGAINFGNRWSEDTTISASADGVYVIRLNVTDNAGNWAYDEFTLIWDTIQPSINLNAPANNSFIHNGTVLNFDITDDNLNITNCSINGQAPVAFAPPFDIDTTGWLSGTYNITVNANDNAGNSASAYFIIHIDDLPPTTTLTFGAPYYTLDYTSGSIVYVNESTTFNLSAADGNGSGVASTWYRTWTPYHSSWGPMQMVIEGGWTNWTLYTGNFSGFSFEDWYIIEFYSSDNLGTNEIPNNVSFIVDVTAPRTSLNVDNSGEFITSSTVLNITAGDYAEVWGWEAAGVASTRYRIWSDGGWSTWAAYSGNFTLTGSDGVKYIEYYSIDNLNQTESINNSSFILDNTPPTVVSTTPANNSQDVPINTPIIIEFDEPMDNITVENTLSFSPTLDILNYSWNSDFTVLTIVLSANLTDNTAYTITIGTGTSATGAKDLAGNPLSPPYLLVFTTWADTDNDGDGVPDEEDPGNDTVPIIIGPVLDPESNPISGATVTVTIGTDTYQGVTNETGHAVVNVPESALGGDMTVDITKPGYDPISYSTTLGDDGTPATQPTAMDEAEQDNFLAKLWWLWIILILAVIGLLMVLRRKPEPAEAAPETTEPQALQTEICPNCGFDIEKGAPCPFCAPESAPESVPEPEPPKSGLSNQDKLDRIEKAYKEGKMSEEQYLRNREKFSKEL